MELEGYRETLDKKRNAYTHLLTSFKEEGDTLKEVSRRVRDAETAREILQSVGQKLQQEAHHQIAAVVTRGLQTVFDEPYTFRIDFEKKRGRTEAQLIFERDGLDVDPMTAAGGGVIDVASFTLRVACLILSRPVLRPFLVLDEPFKNVSKSNGYLDKIPQLLEGLCEDLGVQIVLVTHIPELQTGTVVEVS